MPAPPNKGRYRKPYPAREGGAGSKAEHERVNDYDSDDATKRDRDERAAQRKRVRST